MAKKRIVKTKRKTPKAPKPTTLLDNRLLGRWAGYQGDNLIGAQARRKLIAFKVTRANREGPHYGGVKYYVGKTLTEDFAANCDPYVDCGSGLNVASLK